jgi:Scaffold protein Nfu/NifU N terminal
VFIGAVRKDLKLAAECYSRIKWRELEHPQMGYVVREIQGTPNPNAVKFLLNREISDRPISFLRAEDGSTHALASQIFAIKGVVGVLFLGDFVTINKNPVTAWKTITEKVEEILQKCE